MMASDETSLHPTVQEGKTSGQCRKSGSSKDSPTWLWKSTNNCQDTNCSKSSSWSEIAQLNYSSDFPDNTSTTAVYGSICSEENNSGTSQNYYYEDFYSDSCEAFISEESGSYIIQLPQEPDTEERKLPEEKKKNDLHTKGGKTLPEKKPQQKTTFISGHNVTAQEKNNIACRLLSAREHKIKELKNEMTVLRNELKTFATENKILKRIQSRDLKAIRKYENSEINLPDLLATHSNEVQTLRALLRTSQEGERRASKNLRDVQTEFLKTTNFLQALQKLFGEKKLKERELQHKLTSVSKRLEASDKRNQDLEKRLSSNTASLHHQLAVEKKKIVEAQSITANLKLEIKSLKLKLKERERELSITNIYPHRMRKGHLEKAYSCSSPKVVKLDKAIQVNISLKAMSLQKPEPEVSPTIFHEESKANIEVEELFNTAKSLAPETGPHLPEILPHHNISFMGLQSEEIGPKVEKHLQPENTERQKKRRERQGLDQLKEQFENLKTKPSFHHVHPKQNNLEDVAIEKLGNEEEAKEAVCHKLTTRHRTTSTFQKQYVFSEAIQNLHQGHPSTGPLVNPKIPCGRRPRNRKQGETGDFIEDSVTSYEPSFAKFPKEGQKDNPSTPTEENGPKIPPEKKRLLLEKLFGPNRILNTK